jgi:acetyl-CoA acetyltransferase
VHSGSPARPLAGCQKAITPVSWVEDDGQQSNVRSSDPLARVPVGPSCSSGQGIMSADRDVAIVGIYTTEQSRRSGRTAEDLTHEAIMGGLADAGLSFSDIDAFSNSSFPDGNGLGMTPGNFAKLFGQPIATVLAYAGAQGVLYARALIRSGLAETVVLAHGFAQPTQQDGVASYTTPQYEFTDWTGSFTPAQFAMQARRHMYEFGTTREQLAFPSALIRNAGSINPDAVMFQRGPYTVDDVLSARMIADPFTLLMCSIVNDGGSCIVVTSAERAKDCRKKPVWVLGGAMEQRYSTFYNVPTLEPLETRTTMLKALKATGVSHDDVDTVQIYDHFSIGVLMELEAMGFCGLGEGGAFVEERCGFGAGRLPISTDGGCLAHSHCQNPYNHKVIEAVRQIRNEVNDLCPDSKDGQHTFDPALCRKVPNAEIAIACGPMTGVFSFIALAAN